MSFVSRGAIIILLSAFTRCDENAPVVQTTLGQVRGRIITVSTAGVGDRPLTTFLGVPYAQSPTNYSRFEKPKKHTGWTSIRDVYEYGAVCCQIPPFISGHFLEGMNEDCLTLNIRIPGYIQNITSPLPVIVYIHPGGFQSENAKYYDGSQLALHGNVIVVTINYRLGLFGFLSVQGSATSTNNGLRDMIMSLEWIKDNIDNFGGDPNNVTIFGCSGGAVAATLLLASPKANGLFNRVISQSGSFNTMRLRSKEDIFHSAIEIGEATNCWAHSPHEVADCLKQLEAKTLLDTQLSTFSLQLRANLFTFTFLPVYGDDVLPEKPIDLFKFGKTNNVDLLIGGTNDDGSWTLPFTYSTIPIDQKQLEDELSKVTKTFYHPEWRKAQEAAVKMYASSATEEPGRKLLDAQTERMLGGIRDAADYQSIHHLNKNVYFYVFNYRPVTRSRIYTELPDWIHGAHGEDLVFTFGQVLDPVFACAFLPEEQELSRRMMSAFANFAKHGNPNPLDNSEMVIWPKYYKENRKYLELTVNMTSASNVKSQYRKRELDFWTTVMPLIASSTNTHNSPLQSKNLTAHLRFGGR